MKYLLIIGKRYHHLVITGEFIMRHRTKFYKCICDCGNVTYQSIALLEKDKKKSCGCQKLVAISKAKTTHGHCRGLKTSRLYRIYRDMKHRCYREADISYEWNGGKGIGVCKEWKKSFEVFLDWATKNGYRDDLTLDRKEADKNYCPDNCRFISTLAQTLNRGISKNNTTGKVGVYHEAGRWRARLMIHGRTLSFGSYDTFEEASHARDLAETQYHKPHKA